MAPVTHVLILAAGNSSRLGQAKQTLLFEGKSLLQRTIDAALKADCEWPLVVLGAYHQEILQKLDLGTIDVVVNPKWEEGIGSALKLGLDNLLEDKGVEQVLILLCDQPYVDENLLNALIRQKKHSSKAIVACAYGNTLGVPVLFDKKFFPKLLDLMPGEGAKQLLLAYPNDVASVPFPNGRIDIDTIEDYKTLKAGEWSPGNFSEG